MSKNCKNCLHHRSGVGCKSGIKCINFDLYTEIINPVHEEKKYYICFNKKSEQYQWKSCSCSLGEGANSCGGRIVEEVIEDIREDVIEKDNKIIPGYYHKGNVDTIKFSLENNLSFVQGNIVKYVVRYKEKNGVEDLKKAMEYLKRLIEFEEGIK